MDMRTYLDDTNVLVESGNYKEASERFAWFHNHSLEHEPAMAGVRLSFGIPYVHTEY